MSDTIMARISKRTKDKLEYIATEKSKEQGYIMSWTQLANKILHDYSLENMPTVEKEDD